MQKIKLIQSNFTLWNIHFLLKKFYNKKDYSFNKAKENFISITGGQSAWDTYIPERGFAIWANPEDQFESDCDILHSNSEQCEECGDGNGWTFKAECDYYQCDSGDGGNIVNDSITMMQDEGMNLDELEYTYEWLKLIENGEKIENYQDFELDAALKTTGDYGYNTKPLQIKDGYLVGECLSIFIDCQCEGCIGES